MTYQIIETESGLVIKRIPDGATIPISESNRDYRQYLNWLALGNVAEIIPLNHFTFINATTEDRIEAAELMIGLLLDTQQESA